MLAGLAVLLEETPWLLFYDMAGRPAALQVPLPASAGVIVLPLRFCFTPVSTEAEPHTDCRPFHTPS